MKLLQKATFKVSYLILIFLMTVITIWTGITINKSATILKMFPVVRRLLILSLGFGFSCFLLKAFNSIDLIHQKRTKKITYIIWLVIIIVQVVVLTQFRPSQITDAFMVNDQAMAIAKGIDSVFDQSNQYYSLYKNNNFLTIILAVIYSILEILGISDYSNIILAIVNILCVDSSIFMLCEVGQKDEGFSLKILLLSALNPLTYMLIYWFYSMLFSLPLMILPVYLLYKNERSTVRWGIVGCIASIGYYLRPTILIPIIALIIYCILKNHGNVGIKKQVLNMFVFSASALAMYCFFSLIIRRYVTDESRYLPMIHWYMMGMHGDGGAYGTDISYIGSFQTTADMYEAALGNIRWTRELYTPVTFSKHQFLKLAKTWTDGSCDFKLGLNTGVVRSNCYEWICGSKADFILAYCQIYRFSIYGLFLLSCISQIKKAQISINWVMDLTVLGAIIFYMLWEAKPVYCVPFIQFIIYEVSNVNRNRKLNILLESKKCSVAVGITTVVSIVCVLLFFEPFTEVNYVFKKEALYTQGFTFDLYTDSFSAKNIKQSFEVYQSFDTVDIEMKSSDNKGSVKVELIDDNGQTIYSKIIVPEDIMDDYCTLSVPYQDVSCRQKYELLISEIEPGIECYRMKSKVMDLYDGNCEIDGKENVCDINLDVYNKSSEKYMSVISYCTIIVAALLPEIYVIYLTTCRRKLVTS